MASLMKNIFYTLAETLNYNLNLRSIEQFDDILSNPYVVVFLEYGLGWRIHH